jgi:queuine tRNA-ribosyltransferase
MLATLHNMKYFLDLMRRIREAILAGRFPEFLKSFERSFESTATGPRP